MNPGVEMDSRGGRKRKGKELEFDYNIKNGVENRKSRKVSGRRSRRLWEGSGETRMAIILIIREG